MREADAKVRSGSDGLCSAQSGNRADLLVQTGHEGYLRSRGAPSKAAVERRVFERHRSRTVRAGRGRIEIQGGKDVEAFVRIRVAFDARAKAVQRAVADRIPVVAINLQVRDAGVEAQNVNAALDAGFGSLIDGDEPGTATVGPAIVCTTVSVWEP